MRIAVVGTGISGLLVAHRLAGRHDLTVFEAGDRIGGHTHTRDVTAGGSTLALDTGFIVFNDRTYPEFVRLLAELGVEARASDMSFSVRDDRDGLEYSGTDLPGLFAQRRNLFRPRFWGMLRDVLRFYRSAPALLESGDADLTLGEALARGNYGRSFVEQHILPMGAAVWSTSPSEMLGFPALTFARFFHNHGFLQVGGRPVWKTIRGGSRAYLGPITAPFRDRIRLRTPVASLRRVPGGGVDLRTAAGESARFDRVVLACHSDQALRLLSDADRLEREVLGAIPYRRNAVILHTDPRAMPRARRAWSSWNVRIDEGDDGDRLRATYWLNRLQGLAAPEDYFVTLNDDAGIDESRVLERIVYDHPLFTPEGIRAQARHGEIDGRRGVHFCGAYWGYGFHEDGVRSALAVLRAIDAHLGNTATREEEAA
jgi:predicted NAD/FAD-binding protein